MQRRNFLISLAASAAASHLHGQQDPQWGGPVLDTHLHLRANADACHTHMQGCGVTHAVLLTRAPDEDRAKAEMDAAAKTAQAEARSKAKTTAKKEPPKPETTTPTDTPKPAQPVKEEPSRRAGLFDAPAPPATTATESDEEEEILAESVEDREAGDAEEFDEAA